jgi:hypothetical protein
VVLGIMHHGGVDLWRDEVDGVVLQRRACLPRSSACNSR